MLLRRDHTRQMLELVRQAREIGPGVPQREHLAGGIHRIVGAAMTTLGVIRHLGDPARRTIEQEQSTPADGNVRRLVEALRNNSNISPGMHEMSRRLRTR